MIGLPRDCVQVILYQPTWPELFHQEAVRLRRALGDAIGLIEHVGSTAVAGLSAKPIIDVLAAVPSLSAARMLIAPLQQIGYEHRPGVQSPTRIFFALGPPTCRTHYLSLAEVGSLAWHDQTFFRDYLRAHPEAMTAYDALKRELAMRFPSNRSAYTAAKEEFIQNILSEHEKPAKT